MTTAQTAGVLSPEIEKLLVSGNLKALSPEQRLEYYKSVCDGLGLNYKTQPFAYLEFDSKKNGPQMVLYAKKDATDQLRKIHNVSVQIMSREVIQGVFTVCARATFPGGRQDESIGAVPTQGLSGEYLSNAFMKGETKAKRRVTLSICGLGILDESEVVSIDGAKLVDQPVAPVKSEPKPSSAAPSVPTQDQGGNEDMHQAAPAAKTPEAPKPAPANQEAYKQGFKNDLPKCESRDDVLRLWRELDKLVKDPKIKQECWQLRQARIKEIEAAA